METENNLFGSICLSDIPKELIREGKNGKKYLTVVVGRRKEPSQYGHTHYIKAWCRKEEMVNGVNYYIGELKPSQQQQGQSTAANPVIQQPQMNVAAQPQEQSPWRQEQQPDDLPF